MLTANLAEEIRAREAEAKEIISNARAEAAKMTAVARTEAEQSVKATKQQCHREWRERVAAAEKEAEAKALVLTDKGKADAKAFYEDNKKKAANIAEWLASEVMAAYGSCRNV